MLIQNLVLGRGANAVATNSAFGVNALAVTTASSAHNTSIGHSSGIAITNGTKNTNIGSSSQTVLTTGTDNVAVGYNAGSGSSDNFNTCIGSGSSVNSGFSNTIALGYNAVGATANALYIGNGAVNKLFMGNGEAGTYYPGFMARAWVIFDGTKNTSGLTEVGVNYTNRYIFGSGNVSSVQRTATGTYKINFTTAMPNKNYAVALSGWNHQNGYGGWVTLASPTNLANSPLETDLDSVKNTSFVMIDSHNSGGSSIDEMGISVIVYG